MEQGTPIPLRRISVATNFIARSNDPSRAYCPPSGGAGFRVEQGTGLATCGWSKRRNFRTGSKPPVRALTARRLGKLSICYATHSLLCDALLQSHGPLGKCRERGHFRPREPNVASDSHASQLTRRILFRLQQAASRPSPGSEGAKRRHVQTSLQLSSQASANKTTPIAQPP
jgi:hypothetical protein